jgi:hypothetical protein
MSFRLRVSFNTSTASSIVSLTERICDNESALPFDTSAATSEIGTAEEETASRGCLSAGAFSAVGPPLGALVGLGLKAVGSGWFPATPTEVTVSMSLHSFNYPTPVKLSQ